MTVPEWHVLVMPRFATVAIAMAAVVATLVTDAEAATIVIHVSTNGSDSNLGESLDTAVASCSAALERVAAMLRTPEGLPVGGVEVQFAPGRYRYTGACACSLSPDCHNGTRFSGTADRPIVIRGVWGQPEAVALDGSVVANTSGLAPVKDPAVLNLVNPAARGLLLQMPLMVRPEGLAWGGVPLTPSQYPNEGLAYVQRVTDRGVVYAAGRTKGPPPRYNFTHPIGANITLAAPRPRGDWVAEMREGAGFGPGVVSVTGYFNNDWYLETHQLADVKLNDGNLTMKFVDYSRYGVCEALEGPRGNCGGSAPGRFVVHGLLSEVDSPGEYWWNSVTKTLFLLPPSKFRTTERPILSTRSAGTAITMENSSYCTVRDLTLTGSTATLVKISGGDHNTLGGCVLTNSAGGVSLVGGSRNRIIGNDIYDVGGHLSTANGHENTVASLIPTNNIVENNHFTQINLRKTSWSLPIRGIGDRFTRNLIHDAPQQVVTPNGPLTIIDKNEVFNTGYADGDGGVMYSGASLVAGYGMHFSENFVHHSLEVPGLHGRGGIYFDDHFQAVSNASGNVLYKAAGRSFLVNGGGGSNVTQNLIVNGGIGIYNQGYDNVIASLPLYDNGTLKRGDKGDYIWKTEQALGVTNFTGIFDSYLAARFPTFAQRLLINSTRSGWASPAGSHFQNNLFLNNSVGNVCFRIGFSPAGLACDTELYKINATLYLNVSGSTQARWEWFPGSDGDQLIFVNSTLGFNTTSAGLVCDEWRRRQPNKMKYRAWVKSAFAGIPSTATGSYSPKAYAARSSLASGAELMQRFTEACPPLQPRNCSGVWLAWGECQKNHKQVLRWTITESALLGGTPCPLEDGMSKDVPC